MVVVLVLAKRLAGKSIPEMTCFVSSGTLRIYSINQPTHTVTILTKLCVAAAGKQKDPDFQQYVTPHSCGEVCGRQRDKHCPHRCNVLCHPGPCPPCQAFTTKSCACGKTKQTVKCASAATTRCDKICEKARNCGKHACKSVCHEGPCDPCSETVHQVDSHPLQHIVKVYFCCTANGNSLLFRAVGIIFGSSVF